MIDEYLSIENSIDRLCFGLIHGFYDLIAEEFGDLELRCGIISIIPGGYGCQKFDGDFLVVVHDGVSNGIAVLPQGSSCPDTIKNLAEYLKDGRLELLDIWDPIKKGWREDG